MPTSKKTEAEKEYVVEEIKIKERRRGARHRIRYRAATKPESQAKRNQNLIPFKKGEVKVVPNRKSFGATISELVRDIGNEIVDEERGWSRIDAVLRRLYLDAMQGKTTAAEILLERGWGKVPTAIDLDITKEVRHVVMQSGVDVKILQEDPVMRVLLESAGITVEGEWRNVNDIGRTDAVGFDDSATLIEEGEVRPDSEETPGTGGTESNNSAG